MLPPTQAQYRPKKPSPGTTPSARHWSEPEHAVPWHLSQTLPDLPPIGEDGQLSLTLPAPPFAGAPPARLPPYPASPPPPGDVVPPIPALAPVPELAPIDPNAPAAPPLPTDIGAPEVPALPPGAPAVPPFANEAAPLLPPPSVAVAPREVVELRLHAMKPAIIATDVPHRHIDTRIPGNVSEGAKCAWRGGDRGPRRAPAYIRR